MTDTMVYQTLNALMHHFANAGEEYHQSTRPLFQQSRLKTNRNRVLKIIHASVLRVANPLSSGKDLHANNYYEPQLKTCSFPGSLDDVLVKFDAACEAPRSLKRFFVLDTCQQGYRSFFPIMLLFFIWVASSVHVCLIQRNCAFIQ